MVIDWAPKAQKHVRNIIDYYKPINPDIALKIIDKIESKADLLFFPVPIPKFSIALPHPA